MRVFFWMYCYHDAYRVTQVLISCLFPSHELEAKQVYIQRLEFIVVNLIYVLYSRVLRTSGHDSELHVQLCNSLSFRVLVVTVTVPVSCCCVLTCMHARVYLRVSFVSPSHSRPYCVFTQHGSAFSRFSFKLKLLYVTLSASSCCPCSSSCLRLKWLLVRFRE
jgi:hypothetical protein